MRLRGTVLFFVPALLIGCGSTPVPTGVPIVIPTSLATQSPVSPQPTATATVLTTPTEAPSQLSVAQSCIKFGATSYNTLLTITHSGILLGRVAVFPAKGSGYPASLPASTFLAFFNVGFDTGVKQLAADPNKAYFIAPSDSGGPAF